MSVMGGGRACLKKCQNDKPTLSGGGGRGEGGGGERRVGGNVQNIA
jgi:hypothetical protein